MIDRQHHFLDAITCAGEIEQMSEQGQGLCVSHQQQARRTGITIGAGWSIEHHPVLRRLDQ